MREEGFGGDVVLLSAEKDLPYQRPPLSKAFLSGEATLEQLYLKPQATYDKARIEFMPNTRAERINRAARTVALSDGRELGYAVTTTAMCECHSEL